MPGTRRTLVAAAAVALPLLAAHHAYAQAPLTVDPGTANRPGLAAAANGTPIVNITAPDSAGVSHNRFTDYNVNAAGLVLNNSATTSDTQLAGRIDGNPLLGGQSAAIILNQVTGANASVLAGATEVAGQNARVIVANPNGISVNGGSFVNTSRVSLVAGTTEFDDNGNITQFRTENGRLVIDGAGLDARNVDQLDLVSRSLKVNAALQARRLVAVAQQGTAQIEQSGSHQFVGETIGPLPDVAIDVSRLGSMHASAITMYGTSAGVGVNVAGKIDALTGGITMSSGGVVRVQDSGHFAGHNVSIGGRLDNAGAMTGGTLVAQQAVANSGTVDVGSASLMGATTNTGRIRADESLAAMGNVINDGEMRGGKSVTVTGSLRNGGDGRIASGGTITAMSGVSNGGSMHADRNMVIMGALRNEKGGRVSSYGKITRMGGVLNSGDVIEYMTRPASGEAASAVTSQPVTPTVPPIVADKPAQPEIIPPVASKPATPIAKPIPPMMVFPPMMSGLAPVYIPPISFAPVRPTFVPPPGYMLPRPAAYSPFGVTWMPPVFGQPIVFNPAFASRA